MFGGYETISELMNACKDDSQNDEYHFSEIQKYESLRKLQDEALINVNDKALINKLCKITLKQVQLYIQVKTKEVLHKLILVM